MPNFTRRMRQLISGNNLLPPETYMLTNHSTLSLSAASLIPVPNPSPPPQTNQFCFMFWSVLGELSTTEATSIADVGSSPFTASAWYRDCNPGGGGPASISVATFSIKRDSFLLRTPIHSVSPAGAWAGSNSTSVNSGLGPVAITAIDEIGDEGFGGWLIFGAGAAVGNVLNVPQNGSTFAIAQYGPPEPPVSFEFEIFKLFERRPGPIDPSDPAPLDLLRITQRFINQQRQQQQPPQQPQQLIQAPPADDLSTLTARIGKMNAQELRMTIADLQAREGRVEAARKMVEEVLKKLPGGK